MPLNTLLENYGWRVVIHTDPASDEVHLHLFRYAFAGERLVREYATIGENGWLVAVPMESNVFPEGSRPTLRCDRGNGVLRALAEGLEEAGYVTRRTPELAKAEGELDATKRHLSDMRRLALKGAPKDV